MSGAPLVRWSVADGVARVTLDDPPLNILSQAMLAQLRDALAELATVQDLRVLVLGAEGPHFSAGASVEEHLPPAFEAMIPEFMVTVEAVARFPLPVVAAVRGRCLGGGFEVAAAADIVLVSEDAMLGVPEIHLGVFPPAACAALPRMVGPATAAELIFTGDPLDAHRAEAAGLARVAEGDLDDAAADLARRIARHSGAALRAAKAALLAGRNDGPAMDRAARIYIDELMTTRDAVEGLTSFLEKRKPEWSHS